MRSALLVLASLGVGCSQSIALRQVPAEAQSMLWVEADGPSLTAIAAPIDLQFGLSVSHLVAGKTFVAFHRESLDQLGLSPGSIELAIPPALGRALPDALGWLSEVGDAEFQPLDTPPAFAPLWVPLAAPTRSCPKLSLSPVELPTSEPKMVMLDNGDGTVLLATFSGCFFNVSSAPKADPVASLSVMRPHGAGMRSADGSVWLSECPGSAVQLRPGRDPPDPPDQRRCVGGIDTGYPTLAETCGLSRFLEGAWVIGLDGPPVGPPEFALRVDGAVDRISADGWFARSEPFGFGKALAFAYLTWTGPGEAITTTAIRTMALFGPGDSERFEIPERGAGFSLTRAMLGPRGILLAGGDSSQGTATFFSFDRSRKIAHPFASIPIQGGIFSMVPSGGDSFFFAGVSGAAGWYSPETGPCVVAVGGDTDPRFGGMDFTMAASVSDKRVLLAGGPYTLSSYDLVWWLERGD